MWRKLVALSVIFGLVIADPIKYPGAFVTTNEITHFQEDDSSVFEVMAQPDKASLLIDVIQAVIGHKYTAVGIAVNVIEWFISNFITIAMGAVAAIGFCKITGKCNWNYEELVPVSQFKSFVTPERIKRAESFLATAMEKYAEKQKRSF